MLFVLSRQWHVALWYPDKITSPPAVHLLLCQLGGEPTLRGNLFH